MFWVALATAIMMLSGEGDDTRAIAMLLGGLREAINAYVPASERRTRALDAVADFELLFTKHREELVVFGACVEAADRDYHATQASYDACLRPIEARRVELRDGLRTVIGEYQSALSAEERAKVTEAVLGRPEAWVLDPTKREVQGEEPREPRLRGLEGVVSNRHLTLPRNVVSMVAGPLGTTFASRYPTQLVDGGFSYVRGKLSGPSGVASPADEWHAHLGVRFGLFDDLEAGALFLPFELAPDWTFEPVSVLLVQQFRFEGFDLAVRLPFHTPSDAAGWGLAPGVVLGTRSPRLAFQAGVTLATELGTFRDKRAPIAGISVPLRLTYNLAPAFFLDVESGLAYDDLGTSDLLTVPLGIGAGYSMLLGKRLMDILVSCNWDRWLLPGEPDGLSALQFGAFRVSVGMNMSFQAL
jgi:hypothetical protein